jgi:hypothetical protein
MFKIFPQVDEYYMYKSYRKNNASYLLSLITNPVFTIIDIWDRMLCNFIAAPCQNCDFFFAVSYLRK